MSCAWRRPVEPFERNLEVEGKLAKGLQGVGDADEEKKQTKAAVSARLQGDEWLYLRRPLARIERGRGETYIYIYENENLT
jgi:hypothetical protein